MEYTLEELQEPLTKPNWFDDTFGVQADDILSQAQTIHDGFLAAEYYKACCELREMLKTKLSYLY